MLPLDYGDQAPKRKVPNLQEARERLKQGDETVPHRSPDLKLELQRDKWAEDLNKAGWQMHIRLGLRIWRKDPKSAWYSEAIAHLIMRKEIL